MCWHWPYEVLVKIIWYHSCAKPNGSEFIITWLKHSVCTPIEKRERKNIEEHILFCTPCLRTCQVETLQGILSPENKGIITDFPMNSPFFTLILQDTQNSKLNSVFKHKISELVTIFSWLTWVWIIIPGDIIYRRMRLLT